MQEFKKYIYGFGPTTSIISNEEMNDIMKIVQALEHFNILLKGVTKAVRNEITEQGGEFIGTLVGTLGSILPGNFLSEEEIVRAGSDNKKWKEIVRAGYRKEGDF